MRQVYEKYLISMGGELRATKLTDNEKVDYLMSISDLPEETRREMCRRFSKSLETR